MNTADPASVLGNAARPALEAIARTARFQPGQVVFVEGAPTPFLGYLESGRVALRLYVPGRGSHTVLTLERGDVIGWSAVVPPYRVTAEAVALQPTDIRAYDAASLRDLLASDRTLAAELLPIVLRSVSERLTTSWHQLLDLFEAAPMEPW